jgi:hypothetical protein
VKSRPVLIVFSVLAGAQVILGGAALSDVVPLAWIRGRSLQWPIRRTTAESRCSLPGRTTNYRDTETQRSP